MTWRPTQSTVCAALQICCLSLGLTILAPSPLHADQQDCARSTTRYDAALNNVQSMLGRYSACTASSAGREDCSREFDRLKSAGDDYQDAVSDYRSDCK